MGKVRFLLTNVLFWAVLVICSLIVENIAFFTSNIREGFDLTSLIFLTSIFFVIVLVYFISEHRKNRLKIHWIWLLIFGAVLGINLFLVWRQPETTTLSNLDTGITADMVVTFKDKMTITLQLVVTFVVMYIIIYPYKRTNITLMVKRWIYWIVVLVTIVFIGLSVYLDFDSYKQIFMLENATASVKSLYPNPNFYGFMIMIAVLALTVLQIDKPRWYITVLMLVLTFAGLFSKCLATVLITLSVLVIYFLYNIFASIKKHTVRSLFFLIGMIVLIGGTFLAFAVMYRFNLPYIVKLVDYIVAIIKLEEPNIGTLTNRTILWKSAMNVITRDYISLWLGSGYKIGSRLFHFQYFVDSNPSITDYDVMTAHSTFYECMLRGGIVGTIIYYGINLYFVINAIYLFFKKKRRFAFLFALCFVAITLHGIVESTFFFEGNVKGIACTSLFFAPLLSEAYYTRKKQKESIELFKYNSPYFRQKMDPHLVTQSIATIIIGLIIAGASVYLSPYAYVGRHVQLLAMLLVCLFISLIFVPYLVTLWSKNASSRRFKLRLFINVPLILAATCAAVFFSIKFNFDLALYFLVPAIYFISILLSFIIYFASVGGSYKDWIVDTVKGAFVNNWITLVIMLFVVTALALTMSNNLLEVNLLSQVLTSLAIFVTYFLSVIIIPNRRKKKIIEHLNNQEFALIRRKFINLETKNARN